MFMKVLFLMFWDDFGLYRKRVKKGPPGQDIGDRLNFGPIFRFIVVVDLDDF